MDTDIFCYSSGIAGRDTRCAEGPLQLIQRWQTDTSSIAVRHNITTLSHAQGKGALAETTRMCTELAQLTYQSTYSNRYFMTLSGDHSSAIGTWSGAFSACQMQKKTPGLIWIDAHMDAHTPQDSESQNIHGMPLAILLGDGPAELTTLMQPTPKIAPEHVTLIGIRSFERVEQKRLDRLNVKIYYIDEVHDRGLATVLKETVTRLNSSVDCMGVSIDLDAIDPREAPGVSSPEVNGLSSSELINALPLIAKQTNLIGSEVTEFLPAKDQDNKTETTAIDLLKILHR